MATALLSNKYTLKHGGTNVLNERKFLVFFMVPLSSLKSKQTHKRVENSN